MKAQRKQGGADAVVYVTRSGPEDGPPDCEAAYRTKDEAVRFLTDLHGLSPAEVRVLRKNLFLQLNKSVHGSERCGIVAERMSRCQAERALSGELYVDESECEGRRPRKIA